MEDAEETRTILKRNRNVKKSAGKVFDFKLSLKILCLVKEGVPVVRRGG